MRVTLLRDNLELLHATIDVAAQNIGIQPLAVEKDYWVCESLRAMVRDYPDNVVFKGGTSLEKLRIIERFSEDLDILMVGDFVSNNARERRLKELTASAASVTSLEAEKVKSGGRPGTFNRTSRLAPPLRAEGPEVDLPLADRSTVLLEAGESGGPTPSSIRPIESLLARQMRAAGAADEYEDMSSFNVTILHPGRTLIEKLLRVNNFLVRPGDRHDLHGWPRIGRQFYDIHQLLGDASVQALLADKAMVNAILLSTAEVSALFQNDESVPPGGFARSPAFDPSGELAAGLRSEHDRAMQGLYYGKDPAPSFDDVLERIHESAALLDPDDGGPGWGGTPGFARAPSPSGQARGKTTPASNAGSFRTPQLADPGEVPLA